MHIQSFFWVLLKLGLNTGSVLSPELNLTESKGVKTVLYVDREAKAALSPEKEAASGTPPTPRWSVCPGQAFPGQGQQVGVRPRHGTGLNGGTGRGEPREGRVMLRVDQKVL